MASRKYWRLNWAIKQLLSFGKYKKHNETLSNPLSYWKALFIKLLPFNTRPILLQLRNGGEFYIKDFLSLFIYNEIFISKIYDYPAISINVKKPVIVDIGANSGLFTLRMKQLYPDSFILCYEPYPPNFEQLQENMKLSNVDHVDLYKEGVGGNSRTEKLFINERNMGGHSIFQVEASSERYIEINIESIENVLASKHIDRYHLIKMDCEGAEFEIIKGISTELTQKIDLIIFEATGGVYDINDLTDHLSAIGFNIQYREEDNIYIASNKKTK